MRPKVLLIGGTLNQTTMVRAIGRHLEADCDCWYTPYYADGFLGQLARRGMVEFTALGGRHRESTERFLHDEAVCVDVEGRCQDYDLVVTCSDLVVPENVRGRRMVLVQEGMMEPAGLAYYGVRYLGLPRYLANTAATGLSQSYSSFCVASPGYRELFVERGVRRERIVVTGIPNFDHVESFRKNDFPHHGYVLVVTSNGRETFKGGDRQALLEKAKTIAAGQPLIFKLHPAENVARARREIMAVLPQARIFEDGNTNHMVANCQMLVAEHSSVIFIGLAMGKEVHANLDVEELRRLVPIQNGGRSAHVIAQICRQVLTAPRSRPFAVARPRWWGGWPETSRG
jgi:hypothetical protein